jgi:hypothetical protein
MLVCVFHLLVGVSVELGYWVELVHPVEATVTVMVAPAVVVGFIAFGNQSIGISIEYNIVSSGAC